VGEGQEEEKRERLHALSEYIPNQYDCAEMQFKGKSYGGPFSHFSPGQVTSAPA
jgi:hypothetical protein